jgi:DNA-binding CsgD family transcriptional regulator/catechol 2,3-dioxygenase-like lactoylglutathione lyase family enzyme
MKHITPRAQRTPLKRPRGRPRHDDVLTPAEWRIVHAVRHGMSNRTIAALRGISLDAVKFHVENALAKLGLPTRHALRHWRGIPKYSQSRRTTVMSAATQTGALQLGPIGQISRSVRDIQHAKHWYGEVLGLPHLYTFGKLAFFDCGGTRLFLSESPGEPGPESILYLSVDNIHAAHSLLQARGVEFTGAPHLIHTHANGVEEWMAFFKDPEGRPLALLAQTPPREPGV